MWSAGGAKQAADEEAVTRTVRQTAESAFQRLVTLLESTDDLRLIEAIDQSGWSGMRRGEVVEVDATIHLPAIAHMLAAAASLGPLLDMFRALGNEVDADEAEGIAAMMSFANTAASVPVVAAPVQSPEFRFVANLERESLVSDAHELEGEATLVAKVRRKLAPEERHVLFEFFAGQNSLPRKLRRELEAALVDSTESDFGEDLVVTAPAAVVTPVAVYR